MRLVTHLVTVFSLVREVLMFTATSTKNFGKADSNHLETYSEHFGLRNFRSV